MKKKWMQGMGLLVMLVVLSSAPAHAADRTIGLKAESFSPSTVTVSQGDTVTFVWEIGFHNVVFGDGPSSGAPVGDPGTTYARTFATPGTYAFVCDTHVAQGMEGTVTVLAAAPPPDDGGEEPGSGGGDVVTDYPDTGPEGFLAQGLGAALVALGATGWFVSRKRTR